MALGLRTGSSAPGEPQLEPVPETAFDQLEPSVAQLLRSGQAELDQMLLQTHDPAELAGKFGSQGVLYFSHDLPAAARACFENAQRLAPEDFRWPYYLGHVYLELARLPRSIESFERAWKLKPDYLPTPIHLARVYLRQRPLERAEQLLNQVLAKNPELAAAYVELGQLALARKDYPHAVELLERALRLAPQASAIHYPLGLAFRGLGDLKRAAEFLGRRGATEAPLEDPLIEDAREATIGELVHGQRGNEAFVRGEFELAVEEFKQAVAANPDSSRARGNLAAALARSGNIEAALRQLEQALALDPDNLQANLTYGTLLAQRGRDAEATTYYRKALSIQPELKDAHFNLANALLRLGETGPAAKHFQNVLELDPANSVARYGLGVALVRTQRWPEAAAALEQAFAEQPDSQLFGNTLVRLLAACPDDSVRDGERAFKLADQLVRKERSLQNAEILAMALAEVGRFAEAVKLQENALNAVRDTGPKELEARLAANLALYRAERPCRTP